MSMFNKTCANRNG